MLGAAYAYQLLGGTQGRTDAAARTAQSSAQQFQSVPGLEQALYSVRPASATDLRAANPAQGLGFRFGTGGVNIAASRSKVGLSARTLSFGSAVTRLAPVRPRARGDRVVYARPGLTEWYLNGPRGLEQGFTVSRAAKGATLRISMAMSARASASVTGGGRGLALRSGGHVVARYDGLRASDATGRTLRAWLTAAGAGISVNVDVRGARYPVRIDPYFQQGSPLATAEHTNQFGEDVAVSADGNTAVVADTSETHDAPQVYVRSGSTWSPQGAPLTWPGIEHKYAAHVAISADGNTVLVSGGELPGGSYGTGGSGAYAFVRSGETWSRQGEHLSVGYDDVAVTPDGNEAAVGPELFERSGETWAHIASPKGACCGVNEVAISADGHTLAISFSGEVSVYALSGETWTNQATFKQGGIAFGSSIAMTRDGNELLVGAPSAEASKGEVVAYGRTGETWSQIGSPLKGGGEGTGQYDFGTSIAISGEGNTALVGGNFGNVWFFSRSGQAWAQLGAMRVPAERPAGENAGHSVALSEDGSTALVGGPTPNPEEGHVWTFQRATLTPPEIGRCTTSAKNAGEYKTSGCNTALADGQHEWIPGGAVGVQFKTALAEGAVTLETVHLAKVVCKGESGTGEFSGTKALANVTVTLTGCEMAAQPCTTGGDASGEITTATLGGELGVTARKATLKEDKLGVSLTTGSELIPFAQFACGTTEIKVRGGVIVPVLASKTAEVQKDVVAQAKGKQKPEGFAEQPKTILETSTNGGAYEQAGLAARLSLKSAHERESFEFNPAF
jgi:hypothetical protein